MDYTTCQLEIKVAGDNDGTFTGYGAVFGNIDSYGDIVARGAFKKTLDAINSGAVQWPPMLLQHGGDSADDRMPIGIWTKMVEDENGLLMEGKMANTKRGRDALALLKMTPRPALDGLSIGYRCTDYELHKAGSPARRTIKGVELVEISLVTFPANTRATVTSVKAYCEPVFDKMAWAASEWAKLCKLSHGQPRYG